MIGYAAKILLDQLESWKYMKCLSHSLIKIMKCLNVNQKYQCK